MRELELIPACIHFETRIARRFASLHTTEEGLHRQVQPVQHRVLALAIGGSYACVLFAQRGQLGVLLFS